MNTVSWMLLSVSPLAASQQATLDLGPDPSAILAWGDCDGDGLVDALAVTPTGELRLLENRGDGSFDDGTVAAGLSSVRTASFVLWEDYDGDGRTDLFVGTRVGPSHLFRNRGEGLFEDVAAASGLVVEHRDRAARWLDYDADGRLDLHLVTDRGDQVYHALGDGLFERVELDLPPPATLAFGTLTDVRSPAEEEEDAAQAPPASFPRSAARSSSRVPLDVSIQGVRSILTTRAAGTGVPVGLGPAAPPSGPPFACVQAIVDQATGSCLVASSTPTSGALFPYPGIDNQFVPPAFVGGGENNQANYAWSTVGGGYANTAVGGVSAIGSAYASTVGGGFRNTASQGGTVGGGKSNTAFGLYATVAGGSGNTARFGTVAGGQGNTADRGTVGGGGGNTASWIGATVAGGIENTASGPSAAVGGGTNNAASGGYGTVGGGRYNRASARDATVGGGQSNKASRVLTTVGGGLDNRASADWATVAGGANNTASGDWAALGGGHNHTASGKLATVAGGNGNTASGDWATVGGGDTNTASGAGATVPGGRFNEALGNNSFAAGRQAKANHAGTFVWGDGQKVDKTSSVADQFNVYASGGVRMFTNSAATTGVLLAAGGSTWTMVSNRDVKENFDPVDAQAVLDKVAALPVATWNYKAQDDSIRHMGPMAQDFYAAFGLGLGERTIDVIDPSGVALAAIQGLNAVVQHETAELKARLAGKEAEIEELRAANDELRHRVERLEALESRGLDEQTHGQQGRSGS